MYLYTATFITKMYVQEVWGEIVHEQQSAKCEILDILFKKKKIVQF